MRLKKLRISCVLAEVIDHFVWNMVKWVSLEFLFLVRLVDLSLIKQVFSVLWLNRYLINFLD